MSTRSSFLKFVGLVLLSAVLCMLAQQHLFVQKCTEQSLLRKPSSSALSKSRLVDGLSATTNNNKNQDHQAGKCGIYYYYHVGKTGGTSVQKWQREMAAANPDTIRFQLWANGLNKFEKNHWAFVYQQIHQTVLSEELSTGSWLSLHHHHNTPGLHYMMPKLREWKQILESQGCDLIMTTVLREPASRASSLVSYNNVPKEKFGDFVDSFEGQSRYMLYNSCEPRDDMLPPSWCKYSPSGVTGHELSSDEIDELLGYLKEFDIVKKMEDLDDFVTESEGLTGWVSNNASGQKKEAPKANKSTPAYEWTQEMHDRLAPSLKEDQIVWERQFA